MKRAPYSHSLLRSVLWLVSPFVVVGALFGAILMHSRHVEYELDQKRQFLNILPEAEHGKRQADEVLARYALRHEAGVETAEELRGAINRAAQDTSYQVNSLSIDKSSPKNGLPAFRIIIKGEGSLSSSIRFLDAVQGPDSLLSTEKAVLRTLRLEQQPLYESEFRFLTYDVSS